MLFEHALYDSRLRKIANENEDLVVAKDKPQALKVGMKIGGKEVVDVYTVAVIAQVDDPETAA